MALTRTHKPLNVPKSDARSWEYFVPVCIAGSHPSPHSRLGEWLNHAVKIGSVTVIPRYCNHVFGQYRNCIRILVPYVAPEQQPSIERCEFIVNLFEEINVDRAVSVLLYRIL